MSISTAVRERPVAYVRWQYEVGESELGRLVDALAPGGDEGRDKLR